MALIKFNIRNQIIMRGDAFKVVSDSRNYLYAQFDFLTDEWAGKTATAIFRNASDAYEVVLDQDDTCLVPWEVLQKDAGDFEVSVFAGDLITANTAKVKVYASGYDDDLESSTPPTPSVYAQIIERMDGVEDIVIEKTALAEEYAEQAGESASSAAESAVTATQKAAEAAQSAETASEAAETTETAKATAVEAAGTAQNASQTAVNAAGNASASELSASQSAQSASEDAGTASAASQAAGTAATEASQSASRAAASASEASTSATHAAGAATSASGYASDANASATAAAGSAQTASTKATQASASASSAEASANTASTANANAQAAKTAAETAQGAAEDAQEAAETARDAIQDSAAQIVQNTSDIDFLKDGLNKKVDITGIAPNAEQLIGDSYVEESVPYLFREAGGSAEIGNREADMLVGGTVVWNQLASMNQSNWTLYRASFASANNIITVVSASSQTTVLKGIGKAVQSGHKILFVADITPAEGISANIAYGLYVDERTYVNRKFVLKDAEKTHVEEIFYSESDYNSFNLLLGTASVEGDSFEVENPALIDLTKMFGSTIADYIYSLEQATAGAGVEFFRKLFPNDYYEYNAGELISVSGVSAHAMRDADDNIIANYPLDSDLTLRGIPKLDANNNLYYDGDTYEHDGTVTRKYGIVDLGALNWTKNAGEFRSDTLTLAPKKPTSQRTSAASWCRCAEYDILPSSASGGVGVHQGYTGISINTDGKIWGRNNDFANTSVSQYKTLMSGVMFVYELATPTTETAEAFPEYQVVDKYGTEEYVSTSIVPVGHVTKYYEDLRKKIEDFDVRINGTSIVNNGVAEIPKSATDVLGVVKPGYGVNVDENGVLTTSKATQLLIKGGGNSYSPIVPDTQHISVFYGLAKLAGANMISSSNPVGTYTEEAKIAIQKMLGIYEAPWELIREDTITNETEAPVDITVDSNGQTLELTDAIIYIILPAQNNPASIGGAGRIKFFYNSSSYYMTYVNAFSQAANAEAKAAYAKIIQDKNLLELTSTSGTGNSNRSAFTYGLKRLSDNAQVCAIQTINNPIAFNKIQIEAVTGTLNYRLLGKRKWQ